MSLLLAAVLIQCYASRVQSGCQAWSYPATMTECRALAAEYNRFDTRALAAARVPVVVRYHCVTGRDEA